MSYLSIKNISKKFETIEACKNVSISIEQGELFYLLGPSGCGKSTLLSVIAGLTDADSGTISLDSQDISLLPARHRPLHTIFQNYALFPHMTVEQNITFPLRMNKKEASYIQEQLREVLQMVGLDGFEYRYPEALSGGQQQRVAIARAIIDQPSLLLLDEPFGALDAKLKKQMQLELKKLQKKLGMTFICVTHDQKEALNMGDRIAVMNNGRIEQIGLPKEIYSSPNNKFVAEFIGEINFLNTEGTLALRPEHLEVIEPNMNGKISGEIKGLSYSGATIEVIIATNDGREMSASRSTQRNDFLSVGQQVLLQWNDSDVINIKE